MSKQIQVLIVEDHLLVAEGLEALLNAHADIRVVGTAGSGAQAVQMAAERRPEVIVMDFRLPDGSGAQAALAIRKQQPDVAVLFLSGEDSEEALLSAVQAGGCGFLPKSKAASDVAAAVRRAAGCSDIGTQRAQNSQGQHNSCQHQDSGARTDGL